MAEKWQKNGRKLAENWQKIGEEMCYNCYDIVILHRRNNSDYRTKSYNILIISTKSSYFVPVTGTKSEEN